MTHTCKTPGGVYHIKIGTNVVECKVEIPHALHIDEETAHELEDKVHSALEDILADYWKKKDPWEGFDMIPSGF
jgi:hypothetical protein